MQLIELNHVLEAGIVTYKDIPGPAICDFWTREDSKQFYDTGESFHIGRIDMVANTGTYLDTPFHRYHDGEDCSQVSLTKLAHLDTLVIRQPYAHILAIGVEALAHADVRGKAVLFHTGWDAHWQHPIYFINHPFLTPEVAHHLAAAGAVLVGIDSYNIDDTRQRARPVHSALLAAGIPIVEHMTNLAALPDTGARFTATPPRIKGMGTFSVRAFACVEA